MDHLFRKLLHVVPSLIPAAPTYFLGLKTTTLELGIDNFKTVFQYGVECDVPPNLLFGPNPLDPRAHYTIVKLNVDDVKVVINYDYPMSTEDYVHRIGRTGRAEKKGTSYTFFTNEDASHAADLVKVLEESKQEVPEALRQPFSAQSFEKKDSRYRN